MWLLPSLDFCIPSTRIQEWSVDSGIEPGTGVESNGSTVGL